jgi:hypothetical protein
MNNKYFLGYYSHSKRIFDTDVEKLEYDFIKSNFNGNIICPNQHLEKYNTIEPFLEFIKKVDYIFVTEYDGYLGKGSYEECAFAIEEFKPVYVLKTKGDKMEFELVIEVEKISEYNLFEYGEIHSKEVNQDELPFLKLK